MIKRAALIAAVALLLLVAIVAWRVASGLGPGGAAAFAALVPAGPIPCPNDPNDLSAIQGWAPAANGTSQTGQANAGNLGAMGGALGGAAQTAAPATQCTGLAAPVVARFGQIHDNLKYIPTDGFDPAIRADELADLDAIFSFVRDTVATQAYPGAMRGAAGTLQARAGSPADKALLLAALLGAKGVSVRFVHAPLSDAELAQIEGAVLAPPPSPQAHDLTQTFKDLNIDPQAARDAAQAFRARTDGAVDAVIAGAAAPTGEIVATMASAGVPLAKDDTFLRGQWASALRDHWWLQASVAGAWLDLDPSLPSAKTGTHLGAAPTADPVDALPDELQATLTVRLVATRVAGGALQSSTLVEHTFKVADASAQPIVVSIGDRSVGSAGISNATSFTPSIDAAAGETSGDPFGLDGLATVVLEIVAAQPGLAPRTYDRTVVNRRTSDGRALDPAWTPQRTAYALTGVYNILPLAGDLDPGFAGIREGEGLRMVQAFMAYAAAGGNGRQMPPPASETYPMQALHYYEYDAIVRRRLEAASDGGVRFFFDRPQIVLEHRGFRLDGGTPTGIAQFDIVDNAMSATGAQPAAAIRANLTRGYVDTYTEQHLFSAPNDGGTIALFEAAKRANVALQAVNVPRDGLTVVSPVSAVTVGGKTRAGWWQIDPQSGSTIGRMGPDGAGQELAEYAIARANDWSTLYSMIQFYGDFFRCIAGAVEAPLSGDLGTQKGFQNCAAAAICSYMDGVGSGYALGGAGFTDLEALLYNILDLSIPGTKDSYPPTGGAVCSALFKSPLYP